MKNVKVKDFRQGKTFYYVMAFPLDDKMGGRAEVQQMTIQCTAYFMPGDSWMLGPWYKESHFRKSYWSDKIEKVTNRHSVKDSGVEVGKNHYNFHRVFKTRKQAQRYADRMNSGCLTHEERQNAIRLNYRRESMWSDYGY